MNRLLLMLIILVTPHQLGTLMLKQKKYISLGIVRVTKYTHFEGGWWTSSGYRMKEKDAMQVCAISRDWWRKKVRPGDTVMVEGVVTCQALDTMALKNRKGFRQRRWVDIFNGSKVEESLNYGIQKHQAYIVKEM